MAACSAKMQKRSAMRSANQRRERELPDVPTQPLQSFKGRIAVVAHANPALPGAESIPGFIAKNAIRAYAVTCAVQQVLQFANLLRIKIPVHKTVFSSFLTLLVTFLAYRFPYLISSFFPLLFPFLLPGGFS